MRNVVLAGVKTRGLTTFKWP